MIVKTTIIKNVDLEIFSKDLKNCLYVENNVVLNFFTFFNTNTLEFCAVIYCENL